MLLLATVFMTAACKRTDVNSTAGDIRQHGGRVGCHGGDTF